MYEKALTFIELLLAGAGTLADLGAEQGRAMGIEFLLFRTTLSADGEFEAELSSSLSIRSIISPHMFILGSTMKSMKPG